MRCVYNDVISAASAVEQTDAGCMQGVVDYVTPTPLTRATHTFLFKASFSGVD